MAQAKNADTVKIHYTGKLEDGTVFDSNTNREPLKFEIGQSQVIRGFEEAVIGMNPGDSKTATIPADKAYGPRSEEMVLEVDRDQVPQDMELEVGQRLQVPQPAGQPILVTVTQLSEKSVTLDGNHPLAGKDLTFDIQLIEIV